MPTADGFLEWFPGDDGNPTAYIKLGDREGTIRLVPFGELTRVEVVFPLIVSASEPTSSYLTDGAQSWVDDVGAEPLPREA